MPSRVDTCAKLINTHAVSNPWNLPYGWWLPGLKIIKVYTIHTYNLHRRPHFSLIHKQYHPIHLLCCTNLYMLETLQSFWLTHSFGLCLLCNLSFFCIVIKVSNLWDLLWSGNITIMKTYFLHLLVYLCYHNCTCTEGT